MSEGVPAKKSDLGVRTLSAIVMVAVAGGAFWLGGVCLKAFIAAIALGLFWEFWSLTKKLAKTVFSKMLWMIFGIIYIGTACFALLILSSSFFAVPPALIIIGAVIATDIGAYFSGRTLGGPKIAPSISPSKTWSGLAGGMIFAGLFWMLFSNFIDPQERPWEWVIRLAVGALYAVIAQAGDFFQSWLKRKAGVKDSGNLIPGHGGLFDRTDGLIAVFFITALIIALPLLLSRGLHVLIAAIKFVLFVAS